MDPCPDADRILAALGSPPGALDDVLAHLTSCQRCAALAERLGDVISVFAVAQGAEIPPAWVDRIVDRVSPDRREARLWRWLDLLRTAAPTFLIAALTATVVLLAREPTGAVGLDPVSLAVSALLVGLGAFLVDLRRLGRRGRGGTGSDASVVP